MKPVVLAVLLVCVLVLPAGARAPRVRPLSKHVAEFVRNASTRSPTVARLLAIVEEADVILQIDLRYEVTVPRAMTHLVASGVGVRYVRTVINRALSPWQRIELLGHELQHVVEIATDTSVVDQETMAARFELLGWREGRRGSFETTEAISVEQQVRRELSAR